MIGATDAPDQPVRLNERTGRALMMRVGWYLAVACLGGLAFALGGWGATGLAYWSFLWLVGWSANTLAATEWTLAGGKLWRRRWLSRPGSTPVIDMELGPGVECVHEGWAAWRVRPNGPLIAIQPWHAGRLVEAMERADVRIDDWRGGWANRHRLLNAFGVVLYVGSAVAVFVAIAVVPLRPGSIVGFAALVACVGAFLLGLAIDLLPWRMRKPSAQEG